MAVVNCISSWNNDKCQKFAGKHYEHLKMLIDVQNRGNEKVASAQNEQVYHISSNAYYGYLPVMPVKRLEEMPMDISDSDVVTRVGHVKTEADFSFERTAGRRKRDRVDDNIDEWSKKQRKTGKFL